MERRGGDSIHPQDDADVLERPVGIVQLRADGADCRLLRKLEKRSQPVGVDRRQSPIEEKEMLTARRCCRLPLLAKPAATGHGVDDHLATPADPTGHHASRW